MPKPSERELGPTYCHWLPKTMTCVSWGGIHASLPAIRRVLRVGALGPDWAGMRA